MKTERCQQCAELEKKLAALEKTNVEHTQFAYIVSHDLKAPLRAIENLSEWIEEELGAALTGESKNHMNMLRSRVRRMVAMIKGITEYSNIGRLETSPEHFKVADSLINVMASLSPPADFAVEIAPDMPTLISSRVRFEQVMTNLIGNAIKHHGKPNGKVTVSIKDAGDFFEFTVADDGPGIAPKYQQKIFELFQTLQAQDEMECIGIGLTLVKKIIEEQGGTITLESDIGDGAAFHFTWPKVSKEEHVDKEINIHER